jgi:hypothetical protein
VHDASSRRAAESELAEREPGRGQLEIRPLSPRARERYRERWPILQGDFVDVPAKTVAAADELVTEVMRERGYPVEDFEQRAADVSVDIPPSSSRTAKRTASRS